MITRKDYMDNLDPYVPGEVSKGHRAYYAQFVTASARELVKRTVGMDALLASQDAFMNDIPLAVWDRMAGGSGRAGQGDSRVYHIPRHVPMGLIREAGEGYSLSTGVCIVKEAARQLVDEARKDAQ